MEETEKCAEVSEVPEAAVAPEISKEEAAAPEDGGNGKENENKTTQKEADPSSDGVHEGEGGGGRSQDSKPQAEAAKRGPDFEGAPAESYSSGNSSSTLNQMKKNASTSFEKAKNPAEGGPERGAQLKHVSRTGAPEGGGLSKAVGAPSDGKGSAGIWHQVLREARDKNPQTPCGFVLLLGKKKASPLLRYVFDL